MQEIQSGNCIKKSEDFFSVRSIQRQFDEPQIDQKTQGDHFHEFCHRITGDATEFGRKQKVNLWELSQRAAGIGGKGEGEAFLWQIIFSKDWSRPNPLPFPISAFFETTKWAWANQPIFPASQTRPQVHFSFFSGQLYLTLSSIIAIDYLVINDWARARKAAKNWVKQPSLKNQVPLHALLQLVRLKKNIYICIDSLLGQVDSGVG